MTGPGDEIAADGRGHVRASHADREYAVGVLKTAFVQGRLDKDEFDLRLGQAFASRTYAELGRVTADLPAGLTAAPPLRGVAAAQARPRPPAKSSGRVAVVVSASLIVLAVFMWVATFLTGDGGVAHTAFFVTVADFVMIPMIAFVAAAQALETRRQNRSGRQIQPPSSSRGPGGGLGGRSPGHAAPAGPAEWHPLSEPPQQPGTDPRHIADATLRPSPARRRTAGRGRINCAVTIVLTRSAGPAH
jgi:hypothetical protein